MKCPFCGTENSEFAKICIKCGGQINIDEETIDTVPETQPNTSVHEFDEEADRPIYRINTADDTYDNMYGEENTDFLIDASDDEPQQNSIPVAGSDASQNKKVIIIFVVAAIAVIAAIIAVVAVIRSNSTDDKKTVTATAYAESSYESVTTAPETTTDIESTAPETTATTAVVTQSPLSGDLPDGIKTFFSGKFTVTGTTMLGDMSVPVDLSSNGSAVRLKLNIYGIRVDYLILNDENNVAQTYMVSPSSNIYWSMGSQNTPFSLENLGSISDYSASEVTEYGISYQKYMFTNVDMYVSNNSLVKIDTFHADGSDGMSFDVTNIKSGYDRTQFNLSGLTEVEEDEFYTTALGRYAQLLR